MPINVRLPSPGRAHIDVFVTAADSPTKRPLRVRKRVAAATFDDAKAMAQRIEAELLSTGVYREEILGMSASASSQSAGNVSENLTGAPGGVPPSARTLQAALDLTYYDKDEGWASQRNGTKALAYAKEAVAILGVTTLCVQVTRASYSKIREALERKGNSLATTQAKMQALHRVLYFAMREGWISQRPSWTRRKLNNQRTFTFSPELEAEVLAFFKATELHRQMSDLFALGIDGGFRLNELLTLEGRRVNLAEGLVLISGAYSKNGEARQVVVLPRGLEILKRRIADYGQGPLFSALDATAVSEKMRAAREFVGQEENTEFVFHATRHTHLSRLAAQGFPLAMMMEQAGHKTATMSLRYTHMTARDRVAWFKGQGLIAGADQQTAGMNEGSERHVANGRVIKLVR